MIVVNSLATTASYSSECGSQRDNRSAGGDHHHYARWRLRHHDHHRQRRQHAHRSRECDQQAGLGVTASIITDASGSRLAITSDTSGSAGSFAIASSGGSFGFTAGNPGSNASLTVNGIAVSSASNTVTGALPGVTLNLQNASPGTQVTLDVTPNTSQASSAINQFVSDYNTLIGAVNAQYSDTGSGQGVLADDPTVENLQNTLLQTLDYTASPASGSSSTTVPNLSSLGITVNTDGTLSVNNSTLYECAPEQLQRRAELLSGKRAEWLCQFSGSATDQFHQPRGWRLHGGPAKHQHRKHHPADRTSPISNNNVIAPLKIAAANEFSNAEIALQQLPAEIKNVDAELGKNNYSSNG